MNQPLPWLILFLPLLAAALIALFTQKDKRFCAILSVGAILVSFCLSVSLFINSLSSAPPQDISVNWLKVGALSVHFGMHFDPMCLLMLLIVTGVGSAIHIYSIGYMHDDRSFGRYFACLSLFTFSMLGIVLSDNFIQMFIFWELVGTSSYLLIGFWYERASAANAAKKAFLTNRVGDFGFFTGILLVWSVTGSITFTEVRTTMFNNPDIFDNLALAAGLLIFCGAVGKSAQFPLHVWLPDAMEGPTPVSALIHAATMVAAGVYMLCRVFFIFDGGALTVIAWIGGITSLMAALIACQQDDIKRILAYSTLSQLGYMVMTVGLGEPPVAMFHLATHAFFKALLFLGAGSVIHALSNEQNIWKMGRLKEKMPITFWTFLFATLALCGVPPFSGFYSKDAVLAVAYQHSMTLFGVGTFVAYLTSFYMFRLFFVAFLGKPRSEAVSHAHESPKIMTGPLVILAVAAVFGGFFGIQQLVSPQFGDESPPLFAPFEPFQKFPVAAGFGVIASIGGILAAWTFYRSAETDPLPAKMASLCRGMRRKFYFDELYDALIQVTQESLAKFANGFDGGIKLLVRAVQGTTELTGRGLRLLQSGNLQTYAFLFAAGIALVLYFVLR